jgi:hypothetical protein
VVCDHYHQAAERFAQGVHLVCVDEKTGMQALQRTAPTKPMRPGQPEKREFEYVRHGTQCLTANLEVATGQVIAPTLGSTRTAAEFQQHIAQTVASDPQAEWIFICDNLNTHSSEPLVRWIAEACGIDEDLGRKFYRGPLHTQASRTKFLGDPRHRIRFVYLPRHTSWMNQIEQWFSILARRLLRRGDFSSLSNLRDKVMAFIQYFNKLFARPIHWTYRGLAQSQPN